MRDRARRRVRNESFEDLLANLKSPTARTRAGGRARARRSRRREAVAPLSALVRDPEVRVRLEVVRALRALRDLSADSRPRDLAPGRRRRASAKSRSGRSSRSTPSATAAARSTGSCRPSPTSTTVSRCRPSPRSTRRVFRGLAGTLRDEKAGIRAESAYAIGILGGGSAIPDLVAAPRTRSPTSAPPRPPRSARSARPRRARRSSRCWPTTRPPCATGRCRRSACCASGTRGPPCARCSSRTVGGSSARACSRSLSRIGDPAQGDLFRELLVSRTTRSSGASPWRGSGASPTRRCCRPSRRTTSARGTATCGSPTTSRSSRSGTAPSWTRSCSRLGSTGGAARRARDYMLELGPEIAPDLYPYLNDRDAEVRGGAVRPAGAARRRRTRSPA